MGRGEEGTKERAGHRRTGTGDRRRARGCVLGDRLHLRAQGGCGWNPGQQESCRQTLETARPRKGPVCSGVLPGRPGHGTPCPATWHCPPLLNHETHRSAGWRETSPGTWRAEHPGRGEAGPHPPAPRLWPPMTSPLPAWQLPRRPGHPPGPGLSTGPCHLPLPSPGSGSGPCGDESPGMGRPLGQLP